MSARRLLVGSALINVGLVFAVTCEAGGLRLTPCRVEGVGMARCGSLEVFEDRAAGEGRTVLLNVLVLPAISKEPLPDPVFVLAGGPGLAATREAVDTVRLLAPIRKNRDLVFVDQRGTGRSNGLECSEFTPEERRQLLLGDRMPNEAIARCRDSLESRANLTLYSTWLAADDLDDVRAALGYDAVNLYGISYGSRVALVYLRRHRDHARTATLRGVNNDNAIVAARDSQRALDLLLRDCARDMACNRAYQRLSGEVKSVLRRLEKSPVEIAVDSGTGTRKVRLTRSVFAGTIRQGLYNMNARAALPYVIHSAYLHRYEPVGQMLSPTLSLMDSLNVGLLFSINCPEAVNLIAVERIPEETKGSFVGATYIERAVKACQDWPSSTPPMDFFTPVESDVPALIISGHLDPVAPPDSGNRVAEHLEKSRHLVVEDLAHDPPPPCAVDAMQRFIDRADASGLETACEGLTTRVPFLVRQR